MPGETAAGKQTITTKGGEILYVHIPDASDREIEELYKNEEILSNHLRSEGSSGVPNLESKVCIFNIPLHQQ